jgi:hypothetical protein
LFRAHVEFFTFGGTVAEDKGSAEKGGYDNASEEDFPIRKAGIEISHHGENHAEG